jgi:hypothetical protein
MSCQEKDFGQILRSGCPGSEMPKQPPAFQMMHLMPSIIEYETLSGRQLEPQITIAPGQDLRVMVNNQCPNFLAHKRFVIKIVVVLRR